MPRSAKRPRKKAAKNARLPNAPLAEVVFELRWALAQGAAWHFDPLLMPLLPMFSQEMEKKKFFHSTDIVHPQQVGPYGVVRRFYKDPDSPYPIHQIGAGIYAANDSLQYEWKAFRAQVLVGVKALLDSYPTKFGYPLLPNHLELRYIDIFDKANLGSTSLFKFTETGTSLRFKAPTFLDDSKKFWGDATGNLLFQKDLRDRKGSVFVVNVASGKRADSNDNLIQVLSKVASSTPGVPVLKNHRTFIKDVGNWLDFAHNILSPFFKEFIPAEVIAKFKQVRK
jgi:uncharacterized protein (TIGR04255 family)